MKRNDTAVHDGCLRLLPRWHGAQRLPDLVLLVMAAGVALLMLSLSDEMDWRAVRCSRARGLPWY